ncbi:hypothetical protein DICVIV_12223 [Dictyocaulus viviparus]|uniref:Glycosyltransferase family 92 protein n=1 Tax=Dictyocaulus viviparus TaxID=29172 RepID=A0A0D8XB12_DICVI|nr:hypothetical protein DICVIV_12223 [Dictyocaulus viviparus]
MSTLSIRSIVLLSITHQLQTLFNPCMIDRDTCMPIEDFEVKCTCILTSKQPINATDDIFLHFMGHEFPFYLFMQVEMPNVLRRKLNLRIPASHHLQSTLDIPKKIYKNFEFYENMALFLANSIMSDKILRHLIMENYIQTSDLRENSDKWCVDGECAAYVHIEEPFNRSTGIYPHTADLLHVIKHGNLSIFAVSSVYAEFDISLARQLLCFDKCKRFYWDEGIICQQKCSQDMKYDQITTIGNLKREFADFVRASVVYNFREKYARYLSYN